MDTTHGIATKLGDKTRGQSPRFQNRKRLSCNALRR
jgi:ribosomal protein S30